MENVPSSSRGRGNREIQFHCSTNRLRKIVSKISARQKEAVWRVGFGVFINIQDHVVNSGLISFLVNQLDTLNNQLTIHGKTFLLTSDRFGEIMGVSNGGEDIKLGNDDQASELVADLVGSNSRLVISQLSSQLEEDMGAGKMFVSRFVLLVIGTILCPPSAIYLKLSYVGLVEDVGRIKKKNWAPYSFRFLMESVQ